MTVQGRRIRRAVVRSGTGSAAGAGDSPEDAAGMEEDCVDEDVDEDMVTLLVVVRTTGPRPRRAGPG
ncbi:hypothetical protein GCM10010149_19570 [Nonomuraea roseoviolacea subsp. roseoviolacea]